MLIALLTTSIQYCSLKIRTFSRPQFLVCSVSIWLGTLLWSSLYQVQNLIERCLQLYMSPKEVVSTLLHHAKIEPGFTELGNINFSIRSFFLSFFFGFFQVLNRGILQDKEVITWCINKSWKSSLSNKQIKPNRKLDYS